MPTTISKDETEQAQLRRFEVEVIDRLYALNAERYAEEVRLGLHKSSKTKPRRTSEPANTNASAPPNLRQRPKPRGSQSPPDQLTSPALSARVVPGSGQRDAAKRPKPTTTKKRTNTR